MDDVLNGTPEQEQPQVEVRPQEGENQEVDGQGEPTTPENDRHVPLAALESERKQRQDWKERAIRAEAEAEAFKSTQSQQPQREVHPMEAMQQQIVNERFNTSEMIARQSHKDLDEKVEVFMDAAKQNPALAAALQRERHPWQFAYEEGARLLLQREMGNDPAAYRAKLEAEIEARVLEKHGLGAGAQSQPQVRLPGSLASARSSAARSSPGFTGPTPFDQILK